MIDLLAIAEIVILRSPCAEQSRQFGSTKLGQRKVMPRAIAHHASYPLRRAVLIDAWRGFQIGWRIHPYARVIIIKDKHALILGVDRTTYASIARTEITILLELRHEDFRTLHRLSAPRPILPVSGHDYPFFAQRMPPFFPNSISPRNFGFVSTMHV
jgi:hypothetical protein